MILAKPEWGRKSAEDIWALYYYLLYQVLPFNPANYLPVDEKGGYYYEKGDRSTERIYPKHALKPPKSDEYLHDLIESVSTDLCSFLYPDGKSIDRKNLRTILTTPTDESTYIREKLNFSLAKACVGKREQARAWKPLLSEVFDYEALSKQPLFPKLIELLGVGVCPYCNRNFTTTVKKRKTEYHRQNQIDHYLAQSTHPWLAVSLLNFIPSCGNCNHKKSDDDCFVLYPYFEEFGDVYRFRTRPQTGIGYLLGVPGTEDSFQIEIEQKPGTFADKTHQAHVENSIHKFGLDVLYRESHNASVRRIFEQRFLLSDAYIDSLCSSFPDYFKTREDVHSMFYLKSIDENELEKEPLAKLTHDINTEIDELLR